MDIEKLEQEYLDNKDILDVLHKMSSLHAGALQAKKRLEDLEALRAAAELALDQNPAAPGYAAAKAAHADRANTLQRSLTKWNRQFK